MIDAVDSFFEAVKSRLAVANPARVVVGISDAQDWPAANLQFEAFYCLTLGAQPLGKQTYSPSGLFLQSVLQWVWAVAGTDLQAGLRGRSRGDRYRTNFTMKQELLAALYPYFAEKKTWSVDANGNLQSASKVPPDVIVWTPPTFTNRVDQASGLIYGAASVSVVDMTEAVAA